MRHRTLTFLAGLGECQFMDSFTHAVKARALTAALDANPVKYRNIGRYIGFRMHRPSKEFGGVRRLVWQGSENTPGNTI